MNKFKFGDEVYTKTTGYRKFGFIKTEGETATLLNDKNGYSYTPSNELLKRPLDRTTEILASIIEEQRQRIESFENYRNQYDKCQFLTEFCTTKFDNGRRSGKSSAILNLATKDDLIFVHHPKLVEHLRSKADPCLNIEAISIHKIYNESHVGMGWKKHHPRVFVDCASHIDTDTINLIYNFVSFDQIILVG